MKGNLTLTMIKPEAVKNGNTGAILAMIENAGFQIVALKRKIMTPEDAAKFYSVHEGKPFYEFLCEYMSSGPIIAAILKKDNAVEDFRTLVGKTNPEEAAEGTIRKAFAESVTKNAVHGSDSDENAQIEADFHFSKSEIFE